MRKVIVSEFVTLDGVIEAPETWDFLFWNDEAAQFTSDELFACDALGLVRVTCQALAAAWPSMTDGEGSADRTNGVPKYVVSTSLQGKLGVGGCGSGE